MNTTIQGPVTLITRAGVLSSSDRLSLRTAALGCGLILIPGLAIASAWRPSSLGDAIIELGAFVLALSAVIYKVLRREQVRLQLLSVSILVIPVIGCMQLATNLSIYRFATIRATLYWAAVAALALAGGFILDSGKTRSYVLSCVTVLGLLATLLELEQIYGYQHYGVTATGYPILSSNYYAELVELVLPVVLARAFRDARSWWAHLALACFLVSTVIASAARMGSILVLTECILMTALGFSRMHFLEQRRKRIMVAFVVLAAIFMALQGPSNLLKRLREADPLAGRSEITRSSFDMVRSRPLTGYGLGTYPVVYPAFAHFDNGYFVNHAHNDWLEAMVEGGPLLVAALAFFVTTAGYAGVRASWGLGLAILPLHALVDFPFQRMGVVLLYAVIAAAACSRQHAHGFWDRWLPY